MKINRLLDNEIFDNYNKDELRSEWKIIKENMKSYATHMQNGSKGNVNCMVH